MKWPEELMFMKNSRATQKVSDVSMKGKLTIISGSTSGVGKATLKEIAKAGSNIVMVVRNLEKARPIKEETEKEYGVSVDIVLADFSKLDTVRQAAKTILDKYTKIDVLINSVGIHSTKKKFNEDGIEMVFCVNHLASFLFTMLLLERIKESGPSRIIQINSEGHRFSSVKINDLKWKRHIYTGLRSYGASKTSQLYTIWELADRLKDTNVTINACHPGAVKSNIGMNNGWLYRFFTKHFTSHFLKEPDIAGKAIYYLASAKEMEAISGKFFNLTIEEKPARHALKKEKQKPVWDLTMKMVGLKE